MADQELHDDNGKFSKGNQAHTRRKRAGRKAKLPRFIEEFERVIQEPHRVGMAIIHTDEDLVKKTNRRLDAEEQVNPSALSRWKKYDFSNDEDQQMGERFRRLYEEHLSNQKELLFERMTADGEERSWQRWLAIIERRFDSWNLRQKQVDESPQPKQLVFRVSGEDAGGEE